VPCVAEKTKIPSEATRSRCSDFGCEFDFRYTLDISRNEPNTKQTNMQANERKPNKQRTNKNKPTNKPNKRRNEGTKNKQTNKQNVERTNEKRRTNCNGRH